MPERGELRMSVVEAPSGERLFTFKQLAEEAGGDVKERMVKRWADEGKITVVRLPSGRRIRWSDWLAFVEARTEPARPEAASEERGFQFHRAAEARRIGKPYSSAKPKRRTRKAAA
jgi:hypothetical protein